MANDIASFGAFQELGTTLSTASALEGEGEASLALFTGNPLLNTLANAEGIDLNEDGSALSETLLAMYPGLMDQLLAGEGEDAAMSFDSTTDTANSLVLNSFQTGDLLIDDFSSDFTTMEMQTGPELYDVLGPDQTEDTEVVEGFAFNTA